LEKGRVVVVGDGAAAKSDLSNPSIETDNASKKSKGAPLDSERPYRPDPAELLKAKELIEAIDPHLYLGQKVQYMSGLYPLDWIVQAFVRNAGKADRLANLANNTLVRWWEQGFMDEVEVSEPKAPRQSYAPPASSSPRQTAFQAKQANLQAFLKAEAAKAKITKEQA
jgi:hypothetical protein